MEVEGISVHYVIPDDGDDFDHPNLFPLPKAVTRPTLSDIKQAFPLPGKYHFRFKHTFESTYVWLDITRDEETVPIFDGAVVAKIARIGGSLHAKDRIKPDPVAPAVPETAPTANLLHETPPSSPKTEIHTSEPSRRAPPTTITDDLASLLSKPVPATPPTMPIKSQAPSMAQAPSMPQRDPFDVFAANAAPQQPMNAAFGAGPQRSQSPAMGMSMHRTATPPPPLNAMNNTMGNTGGMAMRPGGHSPPNMSHSIRTAGPGSGGLGGGMAGFADLRWEGMGSTSSTGSNSGKMQQQKGQPQPPQMGNSTQRRQNW